MNRGRLPRREREKKLSRALMIAFALVLFICVCSQIALMAGLSRQNKEAAAVEDEVYRLETTINNLELSLNQHHNLERITARAIELGMQQPDESQLRVVNLPGLAGSTSTQSADSSGAEEIMD